MTSPAELIQGSDEWIKARVGSLGASRLAEVIARTKTGWGSSRANLMAELLVERLTGRPAERFTNAAMIWGTEKEPEARTAYEFETNQEVQQVGIYPHPTITGTHASPDGLVGDPGLVEIKCPQSAAHIETLLGGNVPDKYITQMLWQMACTGREWCDFVSFDPRMPENMRLFVRRIERDEIRISAHEKDVREFLGELDTKVAALVSTYGAPGPARTA
jgi:putative phage-type endonuclease